ncbi:MAG: cbb3-type cytochrome c oxidase subunit I [Rhodomicrobium sp.]
MLHNARRLSLAHMWLAFAAFGAAAALGVWQMWVRSPPAAPLETASHYFTSVTLHGTIMAYVLSTFFIMGFGYYVAATSLDRPIPAPRWAWAGFFMGAAGVVMIAVIVVSGNATVLYTFYPPLVASVFYYIGFLLIVAGSWIWCAIMIAMMIRWKRANAGRPVPLAMFATVANAILWLWTTVGVVAEILYQIIPAAVGWTETLDVGLSRTLFSWTLHAIVYFWLIPAYIAFYTMAPRAAGGRLFSDTMGRLSFVLFLLYSLPVGLHHLFMDPEQSTGFKFLQTVLTGFVVVPTLLTVFTITASFEIAGRLRDGRGVFGWIGALPWDRPMVLATGMSFIMLFFGGGGGIVNMSYGMNAVVHNTSWVTAHFHLIYGGAAVIMYFAIAYAIWPSLAGRQAPSVRLQRLQLWLWFIGMLVMTLPWHWLGLEGQWRRVAQFNYSNPIIAGWGPWVIVSLGGGCLLLASAILFLWNLASFHWHGRLVALPPFRYALAVNPPERVPSVLNGFGVWNVMVLVLMLAAYGYPIAQYFILNPPQAVVHHLYGAF